LEVGKIPWSKSTSPPNIHRYFGNVLVHYTRESHSAPRRVRCHRWVTIFSVWL